MPPLVCLEMLDETGKRRATVPVSVVQVAAYRGAGLIFGWGLPWDQRCQRPREERVEDCVG